MRLLIFGGTTEGRVLAQQAGELGAEVTVSVATELGAEELYGLEDVRILTGRLDRSGMEVLLSGFDLCVDATHPYARLATAEIRAACERTGVSLLRLLRPASQIEGAVRVSSCQTAAEFLADEGGNVLLATGAKELSAFGALDKNRLYVRVLPTHEGLSACEAQGIPHNHILALAWLVTMDGGRAGGLGEKLSAAQAVGARVVLVERPPDEGEGLEEILEKIKERLV